MFSPSTILRCYSLSDAFFERIVTEFHKRHPERIAEWSNKCIYGAVHVLSTIYEMCWMVTRLYKIIAWYSTDARTSGLDSDSFRYKKSWPRLHHTSAYLPHRQTIINRVIKLSSDACPTTGRLPMDLLSPLSSPKDIRHFTSLRWFGENFNLRGRYCTAKRTPIVNARGHFEAIERSELTEFAAALYVAFSTKTKVYRV